MRKKFCLVVFLFLFSFVLKVQEVSAAGPFAYIPNISGTVSVIDISRNLVNPVPITVGTFPYGIATASFRKKVYVTNYTSKTVSVIDISTSPNKVIATIPVDAHPRRIVVSPDQRKVYVAKGDHAGYGEPGSIAVIDAATNAIITNISVGWNPEGIAVTPDGKNVYVVNEGSNSVSVIDASTNIVFTTIAMGSNPRDIAITPDGKKIYVTRDYSVVSVIDASMSRVIANVSVGYSPYAITVTPDGKKVYVTNSGSGTVSVIDTWTDRAIATISVPIGDAPTGIDITPDGKSAYVINCGTGWFCGTGSNVSIIDTATDTADPFVINMGRDSQGFGKFISY